MPNVYPIQPMNIIKGIYSYPSWIVVCLLLLTALGANAQCPSQPFGTEAGDFELSYQTKAIQTICVGSAVDLKDKSGGTNLKYWYDLNQTVPNPVPTTGGTTATSWVYTTPGIYCVLQQGDKAGKKLFSIATIKVVAPSKISLQVANCSKGIVRLTISKDVNEADPNSHYGSYTINWGDGITNNERKDWSGEQTLVHNYLSDTKKTIIVSGHIQDVLGFGCGDVVTTEVNPIVTELYQPELNRLEMQANGGAELIFLQQKSGYYDLLRKDATGNYVSTNVKGQCDRP